MKPLSSNETTGQAASTLNLEFSPEVKTFWIFLYFVKSLSGVGTKSQKTRDTAEKAGIIFKVLDFGFGFVIHLRNLGSGIHFPNLGVRISFGMGSQKFLVSTELSGN